MNRFIVIATEVYNDKEEVIGTLVNNTIELPDNSSPIVPKTADIDDESTHPVDSVPVGDF